MKVPFLLSDYKGVVTDGIYQLVDKTKYIEVLEDVGKQLLFLRPRRLGKSFFLSMLQCYYDIREKENFDKLFGGTYIYDHKTAYANSYHVLKLDLSKVTATRERAKPSFANAVRRTMVAFAHLTQMPIAPSDIQEPNELLDDFLDQYRVLCPDTKLYLMIDEYDNFANEFLGQDKPYFDSITSSVESSWLKDFYKVIKAYSGNTIERIYITGVTPITIDAVTSGATNIYRVGDLSLLNAMLGFTDGELKDYMFQLGIDDEEIYPLLKKYYDGYNFFGEGTIFNTNITLYALNNYLLTSQLPGDLVNREILTDHSKLAGIFRLCDSRETAYRLLEDIRDNGEVAAFFKKDFDLQNGFTRDAMISMLYYLGVLSVKGKGEPGRYVFRIPNESMRVIVNEFYIHMNAGSYEIGTYWNIQTELVNHDNIQPLLDELNKMLRFNSNRDARYFNESNLKTMLSAILYNNSNYVLKSELEFNGGYADVAILPDHVHQLNHYYLFELKYLPAGEALGKIIPEGESGETAIEAKLKEARAQLQRYMKDPLVSKLANLHKYVIVASLKGVLKVEEMKA